MGQNKIIIRVHKRQKLQSEGDRLHLLHVDTNIKVSEVQILLQGADFGNASIQIFFIGQIGGTGEGINNKFPASLLAHSS